MAAMKLHRVLAEGCEEFLAEVFEGGSVLDRVVAAGFKKHAKWGKRDRHFVADSVWETVRWRRALAFIAGSDEPRAMLTALWAGQGMEIPEWWTWNGEPVAEMEGRRAALREQPRAVRESIPDWLDLRGASELGERWDVELTALNQRAPVFLRANRLMSSREEVLAVLEGEGVPAKAVEGFPDAIELEGLLPKRLLQDGRFEIQDAGSQAVVPLLGISPGMRVIDACAGAGGKTLQMATELGGEGELLALDTSARKIGELVRRAKLAGVKKLLTDTWAGETLRRRSGWADRVLIDSPCSGLGTLRRQPDLKWRLTETQLEKTRRLQRKLLDHYHELLREGGEWVYATCSILPSENRGQIDAFLERDPRWELADEVRISPAESGWDGFYAARLRRK